MEAILWNQQGKETGKISLPVELFGVRTNPEFLHEVVTLYLANQRQWSANTKTRAEVSGGGHKPWKQKHTGRARAGSNRSPLWRKGGIAMGPRAIDIHLKRLDIPRRKTRLALSQALSARAADGGLKVVEALVLESPKTRQMVELLKNLKVDKKPLLVIDHQDHNLEIAGRNIPGLKVTLVSNLNAYEVLRCGALVMTKAALEKLRSRSN